MKRAIYISILVVLLLFGLYIIQAGTILNWEPSFYDKHKIPYGTYILHDLLEEVFTHDIHRVDYPLTTALEKFDKTGMNLIIIAGETDLNQTSSDKLIEWVAKGNNAFISAHEYFDSYFDDSLGIDLRITYDFYYGVDVIEEQKTGLRLLNPDLGIETYEFEQRFNRFYVNTERMDTTIVLGEYADEEYANFVKIDYGKGSFFFHTFPFAFTNYNMVNENYKYAFKALSYLPDRPVIWYQYFAKDYFISSSPFRYVFSQPALTWAYYLTLGGIFLFIIFSAKRTQKAIPVVEPHKNQTLNFVRSISRLYMEKSGKEEIAAKKIKHFKDFLQRNYKISFSDDKLIKKLSAKSGFPEDNVRFTINFINEISSSDRMNTDDLKKLNNIIDNFYKKSKF